MSRNFDLSQAANDGVTVLPDLTSLTPTKGDVLTVGTIVSGQVFTTFAPPASVTGAFLPLTGGTLTGPLTLAADPVNPLEAAPRQYIDAKFTALQPIPAGASTLPLMNAVPALIGSSGAYARADHVHPSDTSRLALSGGTLTGPLILAADPTTALQAATKQYVDTKVSSPPSGATLTVADSPPALTQGALWFDSISTQLFVGYLDPSGAPGQWVIATNPGAMLAGAYLPLSGGTLTGPLTLPGDAVSALHAVPLQQLTASLTAYAPLAAPVFTGDARAPTPAYGDNDTSIATTAFVQTAVAPVANNVGRNVIHNSMFNVAQRGAGPWNTSGAYTADRWQLTTATDAASITRQALSDAHRTAIGDEAATYCLQNGFTGNAAAGAYHYIGQPLEDVRRLAGKTVTLSFWANATAALKLGINLMQAFGTGGSPSAPLWALATGASVTLATTFARYSATFAIPSIAGKTVGTNGNDGSTLAIFFSSGATNNALAGNVGVQSGTVNLWGVQLEIGSVATPFDYGGSPQQQLAECQRFFQTGYFSYGGPTAVAASGVGNTGWVLVTTMRAAPSVVIVSPSYAGNVTAMAVAYANANLIAPQFTYNGTGPWGVSGTFIASADL